MNAQPPSAWVVNMTPTEEKIVGRDALEDYIAFNAVAKRDSAGKAVQSRMDIIKGFSEFGRESDGMLDAAVHSEHERGEEAKKAQLKRLLKERNSRNDANAAAAARLVKFDEERAKQLQASGFVKAVPGSHPHPREGKRKSGRRSSPRARGLRRRQRVDLDAAVEQVGGPDVHLRLWRVVSANT